MTNAFIVRQANAFSAGKNALCVSDERYIAGDERVENARSNFNPIQLHTRSYQRLSNRTSLEIATHRYSPSKMCGSHALELTREYATPTSFYTQWRSLLD